MQITALNYTLLAGEISGDKLYHPIDDRTTIMALRAMGIEHAAIVMSSEGRRGKLYFMYEKTPNFEKAQAEILLHPSNIKIPLTDILLIQQIWTSALNSLAR